MLLLRCYFGFNIWTMKNDTAKWNFLESRRILHIFRQSFYYVSPPTILQVFWQAFIALQQRGSCCVFTTTLSKNTWFWLHDESPSTIEKISKFNSSFSKACCWVFVLKFWLMRLTRSNYRKILRLTHDHLQISKNERIV